METECVSEEREQSGEACQAAVKTLTEECTRLRAEVYQLRDRVSKLSFQQEVFKYNNDMVQDLTGLPAYAKMMVVFTFLAGFITHFIHFQAYCRQLIKPYVQ